MLVIPAINEVEFPEVLKKIKIAKTFNSWVHLDIVDGKFAKNKTWNKPEELKKFQVSSFKFQVNIEVHLMVENPEAVIKDWVSAGVKRVIIHLEALLNMGKSDLPNITQFSEVGFPEIEIGIAINPETPAEKLTPYLDSVKFVQILAVKPGLAGQKFDKKVLEKIKFLKKYYPDVIIEADGGINLETAKLAKETGADIIVSASYIFGSSDPRKAYQVLAAI
jgi:ribulose-phosphate 3-epimerase